MKKYQKTVGGVVIQTQRSSGAGFIECPESVHCGMLFNGDTYSQPPIPVPILPTKPELDAEVDARFANDEMFALAIESVAELTGTNKAAVIAKMKSKRIPVA